MRSFFLTQRFFFVTGGFMLLFCVAFVLPFLFWVVTLLFLIFVAAVGYDVWQLYRFQSPVEAKRVTFDTLSLGDKNSIHYHLKNQVNIALQVNIIDELPVQFQVHDFTIPLQLPAHAQKEMTYVLVPTTRGVYHFGNLHLMLQSVIGLVERDLVIVHQKFIKVMPSVLQMKEMEWKTFERNPINHGVKRFRKLGHTMEFEQIKNYVNGDDYRSINWKASGRRGSLMVNQFQEERSRQIYLLIDQSRVMKTPFEGLTYMEHAINSGLALSNIILKKGDLAGLITYSKERPQIIKADRSPKQLNLILNALYNAKEQHGDADYEKLYMVVRNQLKQRSLLLMFTNFESVYSMERSLPIFKRLQKLHQLVIIFFENTEVSAFAQSQASDTIEIYENTIARKYDFEKKQILQQLHQHGINAIYAHPAQLSIQVINKYLELKSRNAI